MACMHNVDGKLLIERQQDDIPLNRLHRGLRAYKTFRHVRGGAFSRQTTQPLLLNTMKSKLA